MSASTSRKKKRKNKNKRNGQRKNVPVVKMNQTPVEVFIDTFGMELPGFVNECFVEMFENFRTYCPYENGYTLRSLSVPGGDIIGAVLFEMPKCSSDKKALKRAITTLQWSQTEVCRSVLQDNYVEKLMFLPAIKPVGNAGGKTYYGMFFIEPDEKDVYLFKKAQNNLTNKII
jgi:hypothetical protein